MLVQERDEQRNQAKTLQHHIQDLEGGKESLAQDIDSLKSTLQSLSTEHATLATSEARLKEEMAALVFQRDTLKNQYDNTTTQLRTTQEELDKVKAQVVVAGAEKVKEMEDKLTQAQKAEKDAKDELSRWRSSVLSIDALQGELDTLQGSYSQEKETHAALKEKFSALVTRSKQLADMNATQEEQIAELRLTAEKFAALEIRHRQLSDAHAEQSANFADLKLQVEAWETKWSESQGSSEAQVKTLTSQLAAKEKEASELLSKRNYFQRKAESLSQAMEKLLRERNVNVEALHRGAATPSGKGSGSGDGGLLWSDAERERCLKQIALLERSNKDNLSALEAYKKAFETQLQRTKAEREANLMLAAKDHGSSSIQAQYVSLRNLVNSLSETIADKDIALEHMRNANKILGDRVRLLEERFKFELEMGVGAEMDDERKERSRRGSGASVTSNASSRPHSNSSSPSNSSLNPSPKSQARSPPLTPSSSLAAPSASASSALADE